jgi:hypothetical protein
VNEYAELLSFANQKTAELEKEVIDQRLGYEAYAEDYENAALQVTELEKNILMLEQYNGSVESLIKEIEAHNLEQQAKGCDDGAKACSISFGGDAVVIGEAELNDYANDLRAQAKALKEQGK